MSVSRISVMSVIGRMEELDRVVEACADSGIFHPDNCLVFFSDTNGFVQLNEPDRFAPLLQKLDDCIAMSGKKLPAGGRKKDDLPVEQLKDYVEWFSNAVVGLRKQHQELMRKKEEYSQSISQLEHFTGLDIDIAKIFRCQYIKVRFGRLPRESYDKLASYNDNPYILFFPCTNDADYYWGVYFSPVENVAEVDRIFSGLYFERLILPDSAGTPEEAIEHLKEARMENDGDIAVLQRRIDDLWERESEKLSSVHRELKRHSTLAETRKYAARYGDNFILTGWVVSARQKKLLSRLDKLKTVEYTVEDADKELGHSPPVLLKNKGVFRPFEFFVDMYGLPNYNEVDPTALVAITYTILFGIMFGDLGQGIVLSIVGWAMWKFKKMALGKILVPCGIASAVFGLVYGSVFGYEHALDPIYHSLFGLSEKPVEVMEPSTTNVIIYSAVGIGCFLVMVAMLINMYSCIRQKKKGEAIFSHNGLVGFVFYTALVVGLVGELVLGLHILTVPYVVCLLILPIALLFFSEPLAKLVDHEHGWKPEKWGAYFMQTFFEVFEYLLSYATNTMSFLRVGAFVLVHTGMMSVVFTLAEMSSGLGNILIVIVGNGIVMAMEGLLVGIQVLRLEFYEIFSRFFHGDGRPFRPVKLSE